LAYTEAVIFVVELERVLARRQCIGSFPANALEVEQVPQEYRLTFQQVESIAAKPAALRNDYSLSATLWRSRRRNGLRDGVELSQFRRQPRGGLFVIALRVG
jgi:hypothetical protein